MAYRIEYHPDRKHRNQSFLAGRIGIMTCMFFMIFLSSTMCIHTDIRNIMKHILIPGDPDITISAAKELVTSLKDGMSLSSAITAFCNSILAGDTLVIY